MLALFILHVVAMLSTPMPSLMSKLAEIMTTRSKECWIQIKGQSAEHGTVHRDKGATSRVQALQAGIRVWYWGYGGSLVSDGMTWSFWRECQGPPKKHCQLKDGPGLSKGCRKFRFLELLLAPVAVKVMLYIGQGNRLSLGRKLDCGMSLGWRRCLLRHLGAP